MNEVDGDSHADTLLCVFLSVSRVFAQMFITYISDDILLDFFSVFYEFLTKRKLNYLNYMLPKKWNSFFCMNNCITHK